MGKKKQTLSEMTKKNWKGEEFSESTFSLRGKVWQYKMMLSEVESSHRGIHVLFAYE